MVFHDVERRHAPLSIDYINSRLTVDMNTGIAYWKDPSKFHPGLIGKVAGCATKNRADKVYWIIRIDSTPYPRAHIVFALKTGKWPALCVDHKNGNPLDDSPDNLREATKLQNSWNMKGMKKKSQLPMGVRKTTSGKFQARITVKRESVYIGSFESPLEASAAYKAARATYYGEFA